MLCLCWCYRQKENVHSTISSVKNLFDDSPTSDGFFSDGTPAEDLKML
jgi:hypothetical protein